MENLKQTSINLENFKKHLLRIVDLINIEGPLLTLFENIKTKDLYLFDWVDSDEQCNRWLIYRGTPEIIQLFVEHKISHADLFLHNESQCYKVDIDFDLHWKNTAMIERSDLPHRYFPDNSIMFEECDCPDASKLRSFIDRVLKMNYRQKTKALKYEPISAITTKFHVAPKTLKTNTHSIQLISNPVLSVPPTDTYYNINKASTKIDPKILNSYVQ